MTDIPIPDDDTRPEIPNMGELSETQKLPQRHLRAIHEHHRRNMRVTRGMIEAVRSGDASASELYEHIKGNPIAENYRLFGNLCGQHCQLINGHHSIEDAHMFPALEGRNALLDKVVARLRDEHTIVHALLLKLAEEAEALISTPTDEQFDRTVAAHERLEQLLLSHFRYEEDSVGPALGLYDIGI